MYGHQWSQAIIAFATKACELATKSHMLNFCESLRRLCRDMLLLWSIEINNTKNKDFLSSEKKSKTKNKKITTTFGKSLFLIKYRMRYAIYMRPNTKDLAINQTMVAYGNRQNATAFARANNSDLLRSLKHLGFSQAFLATCRLNWLTNIYISKEYLSVIMVCIQQFDCFWRYCSSLCIW